MFSLANNHGNLFSDWQLSSLWIWFFDTQLKSARRLAIVINLDLVVGHSVEIRFLRIQCYICVYISYKVTEAISELQVGK